MFRANVTTDEPIGKANELKTAVFGKSSTTTTTQDNRTTGQQDNKTTIKKKRSIHDDIYYKQ